MIDDIRKKKEKGTRKLEKFLEEKGYAIVEHDKTRNHDTITVKRLTEIDDPDAKSVTTTISHRVTSGGGGGGRLKMVLREIENLFSGRGRRGQGQFKLSSDNPQEKEWFGVLKRRPRAGSRQNLKEFRKITRPVIQEFVDDFVEGKEKFTREQLKNSLNTFLKGEGKTKISNLTELSKFSLTHRSNLLSTNKEKGNYLIMASAMVREKGYSVKNGLYARRKNNG